MIAPSGKARRNVFGDYRASSYNGTFASVNTPSSPRSMKLLVGMSLRDNVATSQPRIPVIRMMGNFEARFFMVRYADVSNIYMFN